MRSNKSHVNRFFHESGGQPGDTGRIDQVKVLDVYRNKQGKVVHKCENAIEVGKKVRLEIDEERRVDHMKQHSGQHLVSALAFNLFGWNTLGWWLSSFPEPSYIDFDAKFDVVNVFSSIL